MATQVSAQREHLSIELQPSVAHITLHNPPLNVIDLVMMTELAATLAEIETRSEVLAVVLAGEGNHFSAGVDVAAHAPDQVSAMLAAFHAVIRILIGTKKVTIAAVQGNCLGGGAELAMVCDLVHTTEHARWGFPEIQLGCFPPIAATALSAVVGQKRAADLILTGRTISGAEAARIGLATSAVPANLLGNSCQEAVEHLSKLSPTALAIAKKAIYAWDSMHFDKGLARAEKIYLEELMKTEDAEEGIRAFLEKRNPAWKGR